MKAFSFSVMLFIAVRGMAQSDSVSVKPDSASVPIAIDKIDRGDIRGSHFYQTNHGYLKLKLHANHTYSRRGLTWPGGPLNMAVGKFMTTHCFLYEDGNAKIPLRENNVTQLHMLHAW